MKYLYSTLLIGLISSFAFAQVGINTITPTADLEIVSKPLPDAGEYNGVILPRVAALPVSGVDATFPTTDQRGLMLYLDTTDGTEGIYLFDGTQYVKLEAGAAAAATGAFYDSGTTVFATATDSDIQREGNVSIGGPENDGRLNIEIEDTDLVGIRTGVKVVNNNSSTSALDTYGIDVENTSETTGEKVGMKSRVSGSGSGDHTGIALENEVFDGSGTTTNYGLKSTVGSTSNVGSTAYGVYSQIGSSSARGTNYAVYGYSQHGNTTSDASYSGYFRGDSFAIMNEADDDGYEMPTVSGEPGQVLTTNGTDSATWADLPTNSTPVQFPLWQAGSEFVISQGSLGDIDLSNCETVINPGLIDSSTELQIKVIVRVTSGQSNANFQLKTNNLTDGLNYTVVDGDFPASPGTALPFGAVYESNWVDWTPTNEATSLQLTGFTNSGSGGDVRFNSAYVLIRAR